jgi:electron transport complex protein RnfD
LNLSTNVTVWQCIVGSVFAIIIVKCAFGGLGRNFANPAITARVMLLIAFSDVVAGGAETNFMLKAGATPLAVMKDGVGTLPSMIDMLLGNRGGAIGETCAVALLLGGIYLLVRRVITWHVPVVYVGGVFLLSLLMKQDLNVALYQIMGGGLLIGAIFMATDYVTTPKRKLGKVVFAAGCAILTVLIRFYGSYPEGVSFAILIMNILTPYIDMLVTPKSKGGAQS